MTLKSCGKVIEPYDDGSIDSQMESWIDQIISESSYTEILQNIRQIQKEVVVGKL